MNFPSSLNFRGRQRSARTVSASLSHERVCCSLKPIDRDEMPKLVAVVSVEGCVFLLDVAKANGEPLTLKRKLRLLRVVLFGGGTNPTQSRYVKRWSTRFLVASLSSSVVLHSALTSSLLGNCSHMSQRNTAATKVRGFFPCIVEKDS